jgi:AAA+ superfamily predicted ATPase
MSEVEQTHQAFCIDFGGQRFTSMETSSAFADRLAREPVQLLGGAQPVLGVENYSAHAKPYNTSDGATLLYISGTTYLAEGTVGYRAEDSVTSLFNKFARIASDPDLSDDLNFDVYPTDSPSVLHTYNPDVDLHVFVRFNKERGSIVVENAADAESDKEVTTLPPDLTRVHAASALTAFLRIHSFVLDEIAKNYSHMPPSASHQMGGRPLLNLEQVGPIEPSESGNEGIMVASAFDRLGGLRREKQKLQEIVYLMRNPSVAEKWGVSVPNSILLYGPPGTGKTSLIYAMTEDLDATLISVDTPDVIDSYVGNSSKNLVAKFDEAKATEGPVVLFFDEFDSIIPTGQRSASYDRQVLGTFKKQAEEIAEDYPNVILAAVTNTPKLDPAVIRRFAIQFNVGLPGPDDRAEIIANLLSASQNAQIEVELETLGAEDDIIALLDNSEQLPPQERIDVAQLADKSAELSGDDLIKIFNAIRLSKAIAGVHGRKPGPISQLDVLAAIQEFKNNRSR